MNGQEESDGLIVPKKPANKGRATARPAEQVEERGPTKGSSTKETRNRTQSRDTLQQDLRRVREAATRDRELQLTALWHHVYNTDHLRAIFFQLRKDAAPGVDGQTWKEYAADLDDLDDGDTGNGIVTNLQQSLLRSRSRAKFQALDDWITERVK